MNNDTQKLSYADQITTGKAYINNIRHLSNGKQGKAGYDYSRIKMSSFFGDMANLTYTWIDAILPKGEIEDLLKQYEDAIKDDNTQVLINYVCGGLTPTSFILKTGEKAGERAHVNEGTLIRIQSLKLRKKGKTDYTVIYQAPQKVVDEPEAPVETTPLAEDETNNELSESLLAVPKNGTSSESETVNIEPDTDLSEQSSSENDATGDSSATLEQVAF